MECIEQHKNWNVAEQVGCKRVGEERVDGWIRESVIYTSR